MNINDFLISKQRIYIVLFSTLCILSLPFIAMQITDEVNWMMGDFIVAALLLSFFGYLLQVVFKHSNNQIINSVVSILVLGVLVLVWASLI